MNLFDILLPCISHLYVMNEFASRRDNSSAEIGADIISLKKIVLFLYLSMLGMIGL